jgi:hypothetical protein
MNTDGVRMKKITYKELVKDLKRVGEIIGRAPIIEEYRKYGKYDVSTYFHIKKWKIWIKEIFNDNVKKDSQPKISDENLINNLKELKEKLNRVPRKDDLIKGRYSATAYRRAFGNFAKSLQAAGLIPNQIHGVSKEEMIKELQTLYNNLGHTPSVKEFSKVINLCSYVTLIHKFGSWTRALLEANIPIEKANKVSKEDIIDALNKWYNYNNEDVRCLEYWKIRKGRRERIFPFSPETIRHKFAPLKWEKIMQKCGYDYKTIDQFCKRAVFIGKDGNEYLSAIEKQVGDILYKINVEYKYETIVCKEREWTCDFRINVDDKYLWVEVDGMLSNRKDPYFGQNEKIKYYKDNKFDYIIISYRDINIEKTLVSKILERSKDGKIE